MASLMRLVARSSLSKSHKINVSIENLIIQQRQASLMLSYQMEDFLEKKQSKLIDFKSSDIIRLRNLLHESIQKTVNLKENHNFFEIYKNMFLNLIYMAENSDDIQLVLEYVKINKRQIIKEKRSIYSQQIFKLLYSLDMEDKAMEIFFDPELGEIFYNKGCISILMAHMNEKERFQDVIDVFNRYMKFLNSSVIVRNDKFYRLVNEHVNLLTRASLNLNSTESLENLKNIFMYLKDIDFVPSESSIINVIMLSILQGDIKFANEVFSKLEVHLKKYNIKSDLIMINLRAIVSLADNKHDLAVKELETLCDEKYLDLKNKIFPFTLTCLHKAIGNETNDGRKKTLSELMKRIRSKKSSLVRNYDLDNYSDYIAEKSYKKLLINSRRRKQSPTQSEINSETNKDPKTKTQREFNKEYHKNLLENQVVHQSTLNALHEKSEPVDQLQKSEDSLINGSEKLETPMVEYNELNETSINQLFKEKKFTAVVETFEKYQKSNEFLNKITESDVNMITCSLLLSNSQQALETMKVLCTTCINRKIVLNNSSIIHLFLLACFQNEPHYGLGYLVMSELESLSSTLFRNLKTIAFIKLNKWDEVFDEIKKIQEIPLASFSNSGYVFPFVIDYFQKSSMNAGKKEITKKVNNLKSRLSEKNRLSITNLSDYCSTIESKESMNKFFNKIITNKAQNKSSNSNSLNDSFVREIREKIRSEYANKNYGAVLKSYREFLLPARPRVLSMNKNDADILAISIVNDTTAHISELKEILNLVKERFKRAFSNKSQVPIFLKLSESDALIALEFLDSSIEFGTLHLKYPSVYKNILAIGLFLVDKSDTALDLIESVLNTEPSDNYEGKIFLLTNKVMTSILSSINDKQLESRLTELIDRINSENRIETTELAEALA